MEQGIRIAPQEMMVRMDCTMDVNIFYIICWFENWTISIVNGCELLLSGVQFSLINACSTIQAGLEYKWPRLRFLAYNLNLETSSRSTPCSKILFKLELACSDHMQPYQKANFQNCIIKPFQLGGDGEVTCICSCSVSSTFAVKKAIIPIPPGQPEWHMNSPALRTDENIDKKEKWRRHVDKKNEEDFGFRR